MRIERETLEQAFEAFVRGGSGIVIGAPGSGKTYSLRRLVDRLLDDDTVYPLFLAVDRFEELSEATLSSEFGVEGDVFAALESDATATHAYFIIDALDAARSDQGRTQLINLIRRARRELSDRWSVVVSVRTYDALRSEELEAIFGPVDRTLPEEYVLPGVVCRHFYVPPLTEDEVLSATDIPGIAEIWNGATQELRAIVSTPFSLWLLERVLSSGGIDEVGGLRSEVELLALFWRLRVDAGDGGIERRLILERVTDLMLEGRSLSVSTASVYRSSEQAAWHTLHSGEVLTSTATGHSRTGFAHNILFDYAISILSIDSSDQGFRAFLEQDSSRALFLRPSLNYFFLRQWFSDRRRFWETFFGIALSAHSQVRLFTRVLPTAIIASEATEPSDIDPLLERLPGEAALAEIVLHVLQAVRFSHVPRPEVWAPVCEQLARVADTRFVWDLALVLGRLGEIENRPDVRAQMGASSRTLLRWAFDHRAEDPTADRVGSVWFVPLVAQTIETDPEASSTLLREVVDGIGDQTVSVDYASRLAHHLDIVWRQTAELASLFFVRCFQHVELSDERTHMGGIVIALSSNRRQDYDMVQWILKEHAPAFLRDVPSHAIPALINSVHAQIEINELRGHDQPVRERMFEINGLPATLRPDSSHFWDAPGTIRDDAQELMDAVLVYLDELADTGRLDELRDAVRRVTENAQMAFVWRRLLVAGARRPEIYTPLLSDLLVAPPILDSIETVREAAEFIGAALPHLPDEDALAIERAIVASAAEEDDLEDAPVGRLIQRFPDDRLQTQDGPRLKASTGDNVSATTNQPLVEFRSSSGPYTEEMWLSEHGVDVASPTARLLSELAAPVSAFENEFRNTEPAKERIDSVIVDLHQLRESLRESDVVAEALEDATWAKLGGTAAILARHQGALDTDQLAFVRRTLLESAYGRAPSREAIGEFTTPAWSPAARNEAAQGLPFLAPTPDDGEVIAAIRALAADPVPSVRWLIAADLWRICDAAPDVFWGIAEGYLARETNSAVLDAVARSLGAVASIQRQPRIEAALRVLLDRADFALGTRKRYKAEDHLSNLLVGLAIGRGSDWAMGVIRSPLENLPGAAAEVTGYAWFALQYLHVDRVDIPDFDASEQRALAWLKEAVVRAHEALRASFGAVEPPEGMKETFDIVDEVVTRLYFNSGVYVRDDRSVTPPRSICQFFSLTSDLMTTVAEGAGGENPTGLPASTAHHFVQLLRGMVRCDPARVTHLARLVVSSAGGSGYAFDSLAAREVTQLVEELLADHREVLRQDEPLDDLLFLLDTFVAAGWAEAQHLVFRLEEIFR
ncbi:MAG: hypothetical protein M3546_00015 [Actinomycetota bacterium]|nr:hypothetical protein [Actinomycetota bacterium]